MLFSNHTSFEGFFDITQYLFHAEIMHFAAYERRGYGYSYIGENIWWSNEAYLRGNLESVILDFYNEKPFYDFGTTGCWGAQCGHYTQVRGAEEEKCEKYLPDIVRGNMYGQRPFFVGPRCSQCPGGGGCTSEAPMCFGVRFPRFFYQPQQQFYYRRTYPYQNKIINNEITERSKLGVQQKEKNKQFYSYTCMDLDSNCKAWAQNDGCNTKREFMIKRCPRTCNACQESASIVNQGNFSPKNRASGIA
ncbi:unnamed protein product [Toxocara canis]|uniref:ShKT domain-containing protein n=1 Tax=Toxocara canis TaxID=6265 RepID=A0A183UUS5_TOXCA|nr:unnamed protein product [Toxocara canis]